MKGGGIVARPALSEEEQAPCPTPLWICQGKEEREQPALHGAQAYSFCGIWDLDLGACQGGKHQLHISLCFAIDYDMVQVLLPYGFWWSHSLSGFQCQAGHNDCCAW